ncbi:diaminobutyrate acetyltransferase [Porticoccus sp.]
MSYTITLRPPQAEDGVQVYQLISQCPPLGQNSVYCNLLQCTHFQNTSVAAELGNTLTGFISGYLLPSQPNTLFIWQVAVHERARGLGLASRMLLDILNRPQCREVTYLETTITASNQGSWALFRRLADRLGAALESTTLFDQDKHFQGQHDTETLVRIGPFTASQVSETSLLTHGEDIAS